MKNRTIKTKIMKIMKVIKMPNRFKYQKQNNKLRKKNNLKKYWIKDSLASNNNKEINLWQ